MSDRQILRRGLFCFAAACLLLVACPRHAPLLCGASEACPSGYVCSESICIRDQAPPDACSGYSYVNGECLADCQRSGAYADEAACCEAHPDACDNAISRCPAEPPADDETLVATVDLTCEYGEECCCGSCGPSKICSAFAGEELGCFFSDWCLNRSCTK
jgi:hypothetical protein